MEYFRWNWNGIKRMEYGKNKMAAKKKTAGLWASFTEVQLSKPGHPLEVTEYAWCHECAPMSHATLRAIKERATTGTTRIEAFSSEFPQLIVFKKGSGTGNLKNHLLSKHRTFALTLWPETPPSNQLPSNQPRLSAAAFGGRFGFYLFILFIKEHRPLTPPVSQLLVAVTRISKKSTGV